jgi:hypothetical protein
LTAEAFLEIAFEVGKSKNNFQFACQHVSMSACLSKLIC